MKVLSTLRTDTGVLVILSTMEQFTVPTDHPNFDKIVDAVQSKDFDSLPELLDIERSVRAWLNDFPTLNVVSGVLELNGTPFTSDVTDKVFNMIESGNDAAPIVGFLTKVLQNPSNTARRELLDFCVANGFMIHSDGDILAYKSVREDYTDRHSGTFDNSVGQVNTMARGSVNDDRTITCSDGLHFAAYKYASMFGGWMGGNGHLMIMKISPEDVVSIPTDYDNEKGRCCRYEVVGEIESKNKLPEREVYADIDIPGFVFDDVDACWDCQQDAGYNDAGKCLNCGTYN